jgi:tetratricopeptide (TPR) repeat protein
LLDKLEEPVQEQLRAERGFLDRLLTDGAQSADTLGLALGAMGQLYYVYDLSPAAKACFRNARALLPQDHRWHYYLAVIAEWEGELEEARAGYEKAAALESGPGLLPASIRRARVELELGDLEAAERSLRAALEIDPESAAAHHGLGRLHYERGETAAAIVELERALELQPEADSIHHSLGLAYRRLGDLERARRHLEQNRHTPVSFPDPLLDMLAGLVRSSHLHFEAGMEALRREDLEGAIGHFRDALAIDEKDSLAHYNLGLALLAQGADEQAIEELRRAIDLDPEYSYSHYNLASLLAKRGDYEQAARHYETAHRLDPRDRLTHLEWATALSKTGQVGRAVAELETLLAADPDDLSARLNLGTLQASLGRREEAQANLARVASSPGEARRRAEAHLQLALLAQERGSEEASLRHFGEAVELDAEAVEIRHTYGLALGRAGRYRESAEQFAAMIAAEPEDARGHFGRVMALLLAADYGLARSQVETSLERLPGNLPLSHLLARFLATCPDPAMRDGKRALELATTVLRREQTLPHAATVAMALAELGRFEDAAGLQRRILGESAAAWTPGLEAQGRRWLELYESRQPVRAPWEGNGG